LGFGGWVLGPNPKPPIPNPQSPIPIFILYKIIYLKYILKKYVDNKVKK